ncbi:MAG: MFS transporter [Chloroflexi bacterium]|nr:MFS transporter [Chloroflexota bacterium]MBP7042503.1 MFS transporter [Chloroflexota bacterium]
MLTRNLSRISSTPLVLGSLFYWFYWSFVAAYDPFLNVYLANERGLSGLEIGVLAIFNPLMAILLGPYLAAQADRRGWRLRMLQIALIGWIVALLLLRQPQTFWGFMPVMLLLAAFRSPTSPIGDGLIAQMAVSHRLSYGSMRLWGSLGFALVSILCGMAWQRLGYGWMFYAAAVTAVPCVLLISRLEEQPVRDRQPSGSAWLLLKDPGLLTLFAISFLAGVSLISTFIFGGIFMTDLGGTRSYVGLMFGFSALAEVPIMRASDNLMRRFGAPKILLAALVVIATAVYGHALARTPNFLLAAATLKGVGYGLFFVTTVYLINQRTPDGWKSTAQAIMGACLVGLAPLFSSALSGYVFDRWGGQVMFAGTASFTLVAIVLMVLALARGWLNPR